MEEYSSFEELLIARKKEQTDFDVIQEKPKFKNIYQKKILQFIEVYYQPIDANLISVINSQVVGRLIFDAEKLECELKFNDTIFCNKFEFGVKDLHGDVYFTYTLFECDSNFYHTNFHGNVSFYSAGFNKEVKFFDCTFYKSVDFENTSFGGKVSFYNCTFKKEADFRISSTPLNNDSFRRNIDCIFVKCTFESQANFFGRRFTLSNSSIEREEKQSGTSPKQAAKFDQTVFKGVVDFHSTVFETPVCFYQTEFHNTAIFGKATFQEIVVFAYIRIGLNLALQYAEIKKGINLAYINFVDKGSLELFEINIKDFASHPRKDVGTFDGIYNWDKITHIQKQETFRILKNQALQQNNKVQALEYHANEMEAYRQVLKSSSPYFDKDRVILGFNRVTNGYGLCWGRGLWLTIACSVFFFVLYYISLESRPFVFTLDNNFKTTVDAIGLVLSYYAQFFNPTHGVTFMKDYAGNWSVFWDLISRPFIGLGIYQTIQAFRKYGRF